MSDSLFTITSGASGVESGVTGNGALTLIGNYPNPFSISTGLRWSQARGGEVEVRIYRPDGMLMGVYPAGRREAGEQRFDINGGPLASGSYLYEIRLDGVIARGVMTLVR
jgi:hypothetical protein